MTRSVLLLLLFITFLHCTLTEKQQQQQQQQFHGFFHNIIINQSDFLNDGTKTDVPPLGKIKIQRIANIVSAQTGGTEGARGVKTCVPKQQANS
jgi:hypothetical protein